MKLRSNCGILCQNCKFNDECLQNVFLELQNILLQLHVHQCLSAYFHSFLKVSQLKSNENLQLVLHLTHLSQSAVLGMEG